MRRDTYSWEQNAAGMVLVLETPLPRDQQIAIYSQRPYSRFIQSRMDSGAAAADETDCPVELVATGAIARLYEGLSQRPGEDATRYRQIAADFNKRYEVMALAHRGGVIRSDEAPVISPRLAASAMRW